MLNMVGGSGVD